MRLVESLWFGMSIPRSIQELFTRYVFPNLRELRLGRVNFVHPKFFAAHAKTLELVYFGKVDDSFSETKQLARLDQLRYLKPYPCVSNTNHMLLEHLNTWNMKTKSDWRLAEGVALSDYPKELSIEYDPEVTWEITRDFSMVTKLNIRIYMRYLMNLKNDIELFSGHFPNISEVSVFVFYDWRQDTTATTQQTVDFVYLGRKFPKLWHFTLKPVLSFENHLFRLPEIPICDILRESWKKPPLELQEYIIHPKEIIVSEFDKSNHPMKLQTSYSTYVRIVPLHIKSAPVYFVQ